MKALIQVIAGGIYFALALGVAILWQEVSDPATSITAAIAAVQIALLIVIAAVVWVVVKKHLKGMSDEK